MRLQRTCGGPISDFVYPDTDGAMSPPHVRNQKSEGFLAKFWPETLSRNEIKSQRAFNKRGRARHVTFKETCINGKAGTIQGRDRALTKVNYFRGSNPSRWKTDIATYDVITLGEVYEGIELRLKAYGNTVEKLFYVRPGADPGQIRIGLGGMASPESAVSRGENPGVRVNEQGELEIETEIGTVKFTKPVAFQEIKGKRVEVAVEYSIQRPETINQNEKRNPTRAKTDDQNPGSIYGFKVASYDRTKDLVLDPAIAYSTYLGGSASDGGGIVVDSDIAVDGERNVYVTGFHVVS
ncbi:MAG: SBBP repeat-containing protein [Candidatus Brocadiaceae bacterium]|nr:SBBP repeat-containing protein [Candidatus Brocadiaceae bacterium]